MAERAERESEREREIPKGRAKVFCYFCESVSRFVQLCCGSPYYLFALLTKGYATAVFEVKRHILSSPLLSSKQANKLGGEPARGERVQEPPPEGRVRLVVVKDHPLWGLDREPDLAAIL